MDHFTFTIRTPDQEVYRKEITSVSLTTEDGDIQMFAQHASLTGTIGFTHVVVEEESGTETFLARNGIVLFRNKENSALLLTLHCEKKSEVNYQTAKEYLAFLEERLAAGESLSEFQVLYLHGEKLAVEEQLQTVEK